jgi:ATP-dependent helicase/nuclease subunit A
MIAESENSPDESVRFDYGDFALLSSTGESNFTVYEKVFRRHGIPCVSAGGGGYLKTEEIGLALDLLTVINNPYNDLSLFKIMFSPLYGFSAEEVAEIRGGRTDMPLYSAVNSLRGATFNTTLKNKVKDFTGAISRYRRMADVSSASELIALINGEGGFNPLITDKHRFANVRLLSYYAEQFTASRTDSSLSAFLSYIEELKKSEIDVRQANVNNQAQGCVRLMTIHKSKGLEFPVCFVARVNQDYLLKGGRSAGSLLTFENRAGIVCDWFEEKSLCRLKTLLGDYAKRLSRKGDVSEEMRKLYVAATRAECKLIFTGFARSEGEIVENSYASWIHSHCRLRRDVPPLLLSGEESHPPKSRCKGTRAEDNPPYTRRILQTIPRKLSATQVGVVRHVKDCDTGHDEHMVFPRNPSFYGEGRLTGKKRGDAYHKAMELIDFAAGDYLQQLRNIESRFTPQEYKSIDPQHIVSFFGDGLGQRAVKSDRVVKEFKLYTVIELSEMGILPSELPADAPRPFVQGIADMFFYENNEIVLVDYKTNRNTSPEKLLSDYGGQLDLYKRAIEEMTGCKVKECWLYSFEKGAVIHKI